MKALKTIQAVVVLGTLGLSAGVLMSQGTQQQGADLTKAELVEIKNAQNQVVLNGKFVVDDDDEDLERKALLTATQVDADAGGEAEVELKGEGARRVQEVEVSLRNVEPRGVFTITIDGRNVATVTADERGRAEFERDIPMPAASRQP
jgi:ABC-type Na+ efflux pump permease subunit